MTITDARLAISEVAEATGLSTHTLRYYERAGLMLTPVDRASSSHRRYTEADIAWVGFLTKLRSTGMPIAVVAEYAELVRRGDVTTADRLELLQRHRISVLAQLEEVTQSLAAIDKKIALYEEKVSE
ncbi:MAG: MerR family transcriptional regulator [Micrococcales bacterium 70-64]|nr:MerR family transcriptional regulator [Leifsonia sp.]ODU65031.1 MAG: MerR family transcriptional regulator [Leifsonia sp. SCN 70-46]OJX86723.1 MAG: MerR family transcriptional regulator [Micrococcales bacterium 70-64]